MVKVSKVFHNLYRDSVSLMQVSAALADRPGVAQASAVMASASNIDLLRESGLLDGDAGGEHGASDLLIVVEGEADVVESALADAESLLTRESQAHSGSGPTPIAPRSIEMGLHELPGANLALISTPGEYAAAEARKALNLGLNVMLFSDNVTLADEIALKRLAADRDLMVMGPDCGTAIVDGAPLGFANVVRRGAIGAVAASGTGLQQVTCLIDRSGKGISQALGTGGRDLKTEVGGATMLRGLQALARDPATEVIVLVSKPPAEQVATRILEQAADIPKPVVVNFLGTALQDRPAEAVYLAQTLEDAAAAAVALVDGDEPRPAGDSVTPNEPAIDTLIAELASTQRYVRGLFTGGTFCYEALLLLSKTLGPVYSNTPLDAKYALSDLWRSEAHTLVDLGDDAFTRGRAHPMIDPTLRNERIVSEADDPGVAVILLDLVLGHGAHDDPAEQLAASINAARDKAARDGRAIAFVASVCGTGADPQGLEGQESALREAGVVLTVSNAAAARAAARIAAREKQVYT
ncbi:MAG: acyl-CoA synthetase FdrA [Gammaproteobacteria bacterium]|nr:acyl-CoA synthetase FdrA [Gammaproteobacteria bacterium]